MADAADDRDVKLQQVGGDLFAVFKHNLASVLFSDGADCGLEPGGGGGVKCSERQINRVVLIQDVEAARAVVGFPPPPFYSFFFIFFLFFYFYFYFILFFLLLSIFFFPL